MLKKRVASFFLVMSCASAGAQGLDGFWQGPGKLQPGSQPCGGSDATYEIQIKSGEVSGRAWAPETFSPITGRVVDDSRILISTPLWGFTDMEARVVGGEIRFTQKGRRCHYEATLQRTQPVASPVAVSQFKPYRLVGDWSFRNAQTAQVFGGAIEAAVESIEPTGVMKGRISYDGQQLNDRCSTRSGFQDKPVPVEILKTATGYRVEFVLECATGQSPRPFSQAYTCDEKGVCTIQTQNGNGRGVITLTEMR